MKSRLFATLLAASAAAALAGCSSEQSVSTDIPELSGAPASMSQGGTAAAPAQPAGEAAIGSTTVAAAPAAGMAPAEPYIVPEAAQPGGQTAAVAPPAGAGPGGGAGGAFSRLDANGDGGLDSAEFSRLLAFRFRQSDADGNGSISQGEMQGQRAAQRFPRMDRNADGALSQEEFVQAQLALLPRLDSDGDGRVSEPEFAAIMQRRR
jgi:hypothetical protein